MVLIRVSASLAIYITVPNIPSGDYVVRVCDDYLTVSSGARDDSDTSFSIASSTTSACNSPLYTASVLDITRFPAVSAAGSL